MEPKTGSYRSAGVDIDAAEAAKDDIAQRVTMLVAFAVIREPLIDPRSMDRQRQRISEALKPMTMGKSPDIRVHSIAIANERPGVTANTVTYTNLRTGTKTTVTR